MGQNIYLGGGPVENAVLYWYEKGKEYDFQNPGPSADASEFTALLWYDTTHVGMARSQCGTFIVANYYPPGNWDDEELYKQNVRPLKAEFTWKPRNLFEKMLADQFEALAAERANKGHPSDDPMMVPIAELVELFKSIGQPELAEAVQKSDADGDGYIHAGEFVHAACTLKHADKVNKQADAEMVHNLKRLVGITTVDENGDNMLDPEEFIKYLRLVTGNTWTPEKANALMARFDTDANGLLDYNELTALHDSGALLTAATEEGSPILLDRFGLSTEKWLADVPCRDLVQKLRLHLDRGGRARVTLSQVRQEGRLVVKFIVDAPGGKTRFHTEQSAWSDAPISRSNSKRTDDDTATPREGGNAAHAMARRVHAARATLADPAAHHVPRSSVRLSKSGHPPAARISVQAPST